jgi:hypothetical protein
MSQESKPYGPPYPTLKEGDYVGWQDEEGALHVVKFKRWTLSDPIQRVYDEMASNLGRMLNIEAGLREIVGDDQS